jgi:hypothetical protein
MSTERALSIFSPDQLNKFVADTLPPATEHPGKVALAFGLDKSGAKVVANFTSEPHASGWQWKFQVGYHYDWQTHDNNVGALFTILT